LNPVRPRPTSQDQNRGLGHPTFVQYALTSFVDRSRDFVEPSGGFEKFAGTGAVGGAGEAVALRQADEVGGTAIADVGAALAESRRLFCPGSSILGLPGNLS
jgi:hypothetical protein